MVALQMTHVKATPSSAPTLAAIASTTQVVARTELNVALGQNSY